MRIKSLYIKEYKILKDFYIDFHEDINTNVIIGKNGSGKTTLFEAIIQIFREPTLVNNVPYLKRAFKDLKLEFEIKYLCKGKDILFSNIDDKLVWLADGNNLLENDNLFSYHELFENTPYIPKKILDFMPDHIITYYAGESDRVTSLFEKPLSDAAKLLQKGKQIPLRQFLNVNTKDIRKILVSLFSSSNYENVDSKDLEEFQIFFKKPKWFTTAKNNFEQLEEKNGVEDATGQFNPDFYYAEGEIGKFLGVIKKNAYTGNFDLDSQEYVSMLGVKSKDLFMLKDPHNNILTDLDLYKFLDHTNHSDLIESIKLFFNIDSRKDPIELSQFSEGEQQIKLVTGLFELFKDKETLFLFDEPDTYLHPEWQVKLMEKLLSTENSNIFLTTHSTIALNRIDENKGGNIIILKNGELYPLPENFKAYGSNSETLLKVFQNVLESLPVGFQKQIKEIERLVNSDLKRGKEELGKLRKIVGPNNKAIKNLETLIEIQEL